MFELLGSGITVLLLDQWSKRWVYRRLRDRDVQLGRVMRFRVVAGPEYLLRPQARIVLGFVWVVALLSILALRASGEWFQSPLALAALGAALGGAAGNLFDMLRQRRVVDFIDLRWWPVFNLADVAIVGGLGIAAVAQTLSA